MAAASNRPPMATSRGRAHARPHFLGGETKARGGSGGEGREVGGGLFGLGWDGGCCLHPGWELLLVRVQSRADPACSRSGRRSLLKPKHPRGGEKDTVLGSRGEGWGRCAEAQVSSLQVILGLGLGDWGGHNHVTSVWQLWGRSWLCLQLAAQFPRFSFPVGEMRVTNPA